jgi:hypothetical protein
MKYSLIFLILNIFNSYCQIKSDTIIINIQDIDTIISKYSSNPRIEPKTVKQLFYKNSKLKLSGLFKIITSDTSYCITNLDQGIETNSGYNIIKYYKNELLDKIEFKGNAYFGSKYLSVTNYEIKNNIILRAFWKDIANDELIEDVEIKQFLKKNVIIWYVISKKAKKIKWKFDKIQFE